MSAGALVRTGPAALDQALLKAVGLDRVPAEQRTLALHIAERYELDLMLKHLVMVEGRPYITRDGLLHVAHRSGVFDGIEVSKPVLGETHWEASATVYRKDMTRGFTYWGRYPKSGGNQRYAPEMATKTAECMALRRAFDVSAPVVEERWDLDTGEAIDQPRQPVSLAAKVSARRADIEQRTDDEPPSAPVASGEVEPPPGSGAPSPDDAAALGVTAQAGSVAAHGTVMDTDPATQCESTSDPRMPPVERCRREAGHKGSHKTSGMTWPNTEGAK